MGCLGHVPSRRITLTLLAGAATAAVAGVVLVTFEPSSEVWERQPAVQQIAMRRRVAAKDPPLGTRLDFLRDRVVGGTGLGARSLSAALVVVHGGDGPCCSDAIARWRSLAQGMLPGVALIAVVPGSERRNQRTGGVVTDTGGRIARGLNAGWVPRAYLVSGDGRLIWCEPADAPDLSAAATAAATAYRIWQH